MRITEKEMEKIEELTDYLYIDGSHHKQYALVRLLEMMLSKKKFAIRYPDCDRGIPA